MHLKEPRYSILLHSLFVFVIIIIIIVNFHEVYFMFQNVRHINNILFYFLISKFYIIFLFKKFI